MGHMGSHGVTWGHMGSHGVNGVTWGQWGHMGSHGVNGVTWCHMGSQVTPALTNIQCPEVLP